MAKMGDIRDSGRAPSRRRAFTHRTDAAVQEDDEVPSGGGGDLLRPSACAQRRTFNTAHSLTHSGSAQYVRTKRTAVRSILLSSHVRGSGSHLPRGRPRPRPRHRPRHARQVPHRDREGALGPKLAAPKVSADAAPQLGGRHRRASGDLQLLGDEMLVVGLDPDRQRIGMDGLGPDAGSALADLDARGVGKRMYGSERG